MAFHARGGIAPSRGLEHFELASRSEPMRPRGLFVNDRLDVALAVGAAVSSWGGGASLLRTRAA